MTHIPREDILDLDRAIWSVACAFCGANAGEACRQTSRRPGKPQTTTGVPHQARVRQGHFILKETHTNPGKVSK